MYTYTEGVQWCIQVAEGLLRLNTASPMIVHRDLKLDNILLAGAQPTGAKIHNLWKCTITHRYAFTLECIVKAVRSLLIWLYQTFPDCVALL